ncbi:MAG: hypothetical protein KAI33_05815, partial [Elusimicrobiales bacterium]|nr:hypothetical protein [Elusimicrobiales bacterium]
MFKKWEGEREGQFKLERETFINELQLGRDTAKKEADEKIEHINKIWRQKLRQKEEEFKTKHQLEIEEIQGQLREDSLKQTKNLTDKLNSEFKKREQELTLVYKNWITENKNLSKEEQESRVWKVENEYKKQTLRLSEMLKEVKEELEKSESDSKKNLLTIKQHYQKKEIELETLKKEIETNQKIRETNLEERYSNRETALLSRIKIKTEDLKNKEKSLEDAYGAKIKDLSLSMEDRNKRLNEQKQKLKREEQNLKNFKNRISNILKERESELESNIEQRYLLLKQSLEESFVLKEKNLLKKSDDLQKQSGILDEQKTSMFETIRILENKNKKLDLNLFQKEEEIKNEYQKKLELEEERLSRRLKIKEEALERQRELLINQASILEDKFLDSLKEKEVETAKNFKQTVETLNSHTLKEQENHSLEMGAI